MIGSHPEEGAFPPANSGELVKQLMAELENFEDIAKYLMPQPEDVPHLRGIDIFGGTLPLSGVVGGDHLMYVDFTRRFDLDARIAHAIANGQSDIVRHLKQCQRSAGIVLVDITGHHVTDALMAAMLHQAFLVGVIYELDMFGRVTGRLFENINEEFHRSSSEHKFVSLIYGEISEDARFRFLDAAQPFPSVFSNRHGRFMTVSQRRCISFPPVGLLPSLDVTDRPKSPGVFGFKAHYETNEWLLMGQGDVLLLHTDGLTEHQNGDEEYFPGRLERTLQQVKQLPAEGIYEAIVTDVLAFGPPADDISVVVIKRLS